MHINPSNHREKVTDTLNQHAQGIPHCNSRFVRLEGDWLGKYCGGRFDNKQSLLVQFGIVQRERVHLGSAHVYLACF